MFETAKWIGSEDHGTEHGSYLCRKTFTVVQNVKQAAMYVCGLGYGVYSINGKRVSPDVLSTPFTKFDSTVLYLTYDVTSLLRRGQNALGAYLGNGFYHDVNLNWEYNTASWKDHPKLLMQLEISYTDGSVQVVQTDSSWKTSFGPSVYNHIREGEIYDARKEQAGWDTPGFDDAAWPFAVLAHSPGGVLRPAKLPPIRKTRVLVPQKRTDCIYDFQENISGFVHIKGTGNAGQEVTVVYAERFCDGDIDNENINLYTSGDLKHTDRYIFKGEGVEEWEPDFVYHGFRYVKLIHAPDNLEVTACMVHTDFPVVGEFSCGDSMLNRIHEACRRSTLTNFHSIPTDCPHREQNGWTGDAQWSADQALMNFDMAGAYQKWMLDFKDAQRPSGQLPGIVPSPGWGYNWGSGPAWDSALFVIPWSVYRLTGSDALIRDMWENMERSLAYMGSMAQEHIVQFGLPDWCTPKNSSIRCPGDASDTAYYYGDAVIMAKCAALLGKPAKSYETLARNIRKAYRQRFLNRPELEEIQTFLACGIYQGLYNEDEIPGKARRLAQLVEQNGWHIDCGTIGTKFIFCALAENGYSDVLYRMVTVPTCPSYAWWMENGMTTLCEDWEMKESLNHHMFSEVDFWFYRYLAGIRLDAGSLVIEPCRLPALGWVKARHKDILVEWDLRSLTVEVPKTATVVFGGKRHTVEAGRHTFYEEGSAL